MGDSVNEHYTSGNGGGWGGYPGWGAGAGAGTAGGLLAGLIGGAVGSKLLGHDDGRGGREDLSNIRKEVQDVKSDVRETVQQESLRTTDLFARLSSETFGAQKDAIRAEYDAKIAGIKAEFETKFEGEKVIKEVDNKVEYARDSIQAHLTRESERTDSKLCKLADEILIVEKNLDGKFCGVKEEVGALARRLDDRFFELRERELVAEKECLKDKLATCTLNNQTLSIVNELKSVMCSAMSSSISNSGSIANNKTTTVANTAV